MVKPYFINKSKTKEKSYLSKKRTVPDEPTDEVDMVKLKKKINKLMLSVCNEINTSTTNDLNILYESMFKKYLLNEFTPNCLNYINRIIIDTSKNHLKKFQGIFELNKIIVLIIKELFMNEFELILLSLYLELIDLSSNKDINTFKEALIFLCFFIKKLTLSEKNLAPINSFLNRKYQRFDEKYNLWIQSYTSILDEKILYFNYNKINERFIEYNQTHSIYCKNNYIDYNLIIDRILTMSIPYNENRNDNPFINKKIGLGNIDSTSELNNLISTFKNDLQENTNINLNSFINNNYNINNINNNETNLNINGKYLPYYNSAFTTNALNNQNSNLNNLYNKNNMFNQMNAINNQQINNNFMNTSTKDLIKPVMQEQEINVNKNISGVKSINEIEINNIKNNLQNEGNKKSLNPKKLFITQEQKKNNNNISSNNIESKDNNINNINNSQIDMTPKTLLYLLSQKQLNEQGNNNNIPAFKRNNSNASIMNNITTKNNNNENLSLLQSNLLGLNASQQINYYNKINYNGPLGLNDINGTSQFSIFSSKNPYLSDMYNNNIFRGNEDENFKFIGQSSDNFFKSYYSMNGITSSRNFYPNLSNNNNYGNTNVQENMNNNNNNNINSLQINQLLPGNQALNINAVNNQPNNEGFTTNNSSKDKNINTSNNINIHNDNK